MQTVYLLKDCYKSYTALKKLYNYPDLSTNIIIVDNEQARILLLDKRVKKFPFIINSLPTSIGLIPKIAKVLPLEMFMMLKKFHEEKKRNVETKRFHTTERILNIPSVDHNYVKQNRIPVVNHYAPICNKRPIHIYRPRPRPSKFQPLIKTVKETDGSVNIILNK